MKELEQHIELKTPVTVGERTIKELNIRRPKTRDFLATDGHAADSVGADIALLSSLTGESDLLLKEIDVDDWAVIRTALQMIWLRYFGLKPKAEGEAENPPKPEAEKD